MNRSDVYKLVDGEREYQDSKRPCVDVKEDSEHSVADWVIFLDKLVQDAKMAVYHLDEKAVLENVRKITAVGVACMECFDTPPRKS